MYQEATKRSTSMLSLGCIQAVLWMAVIDAVIVDTLKCAQSRLDVLGVLGTPG